LGRAGKQKKAIEELSQRSKAAPMTATIEDLLTDYRAILESRGSLTPEDEELIMNLSTVYLKQRETWKSEGLEEGRQEGRQEALETIAIALLREGLSIDLILKTTGISRDRLQVLQSNLE
jgi:predicted transposase/invertase (TIGR01784 family)